MTSIICGPVYRLFGLHVIYCLDGLHQESSLSSLGRLCLLCVV